jgi:acyl-CoA hydrolase
MTSATLEFTELFSDGVIELGKLGYLRMVETPIRKILLKRFHHRQPLILDGLMTIRLSSHPTEYVNDPFVIAQISVRWLLSAIEVDITGQVCADSIGPGCSAWRQRFYGITFKGGVLSLPCPVRQRARWHSGQPDCDYA